MKMTQEAPIPDEVLKEHMDRIKSSPGEWIVAILLSVLIPGLGVIYFGEIKKGLKLFFLAAAIYVLEAVLYEFILTSENIFIPLLHSIVLLASIVVWLYNVVETIRLYEVDMKLWYMKISAADKIEILDKDLSERVDILHIAKLGLWISAKLDFIKFKLEREEKEKKGSNLDLMMSEPKRAIIYLSLMVSMTFVATKVNSFLDKMWISKISEEAVSAISTVSPIYSVVAAIGVGVGTGACICISYALGKKDFDRSQKLADASVFLSILLSIPTALFLILSIDPIVSVQGPEITELATQYVIPLAIGCPAIILTGVLGSLFKAEGAMKIMTFCSLLSIPVNAILTPVFINVCWWGILGASAATVLGSLVSMIASFHYFKKGNYHFKIRIKAPQSAAIREVLTVGGPKAVEEVLGGILMLAQTVLVAVTAGSAALAITGLGFAFPYLMTTIPDSISAGSQPVCSAQAGAHNTDVMRSSMSYSFKLMIGLSLIPTIVLLLFTEPILSIFGNGNTVMSEDLVNATRIYALAIPFYLLQRMCTNMLQVVRKSHISAPIYIGFGILRLVLIVLFVSTAMGAVIVECSIYLMSAIVLGLALMYYAKTFDPDKVDENAEKRLDLLASLRPIKKTADS